MITRTATALLLALVSSARVGAEGRVEFNRDIRPILSDRCFYCHGPDEKTREADLRLDVREAAVADLGGYAAIVPGKPSESELFLRVTSGDPDEVMPQPKAKKKMLDPEEVALFRKWIEQGAEYQGHWAFEPVAAPTPPGDLENPIDAFVRARLTAEGVEPSPRADKHTLARRAYLDLVGLLPTPEEAEAFANSKDPSAYEKLVDGLLASPHYGERWGRHWLDGARYADSHGYSVDGERQMWPYRDWVIASLNADMPFDQFTVEQIAGDLLPDATKAQKVASAFHRNTLINQEGGSDPEQFRNEANMDRVNTTGAVWLGLTLGCAQCHTHKFDPIPHEEYYQMFAFFNSSADRNNAGPVIEVDRDEMFGLKGEPAPVPKPTAPPGWTPMKITQAKSASGGALEIKPDRSVLVDADAAAANDSYQIVADHGLERIASVQLRVLTDGSLPKNGPGTAGNGNFVLTRAKVFVGGDEVAIKSASADHQQPGYPASAAIDGDKSTGWAINIARGSRRKMNAPHALVLEFTQPVAAKGKPVEVRLFHDKNEDYLIGRFALDASPVPAAPHSADGGGGGAVTPKKKLARLMIMGESKNPPKTYVLTRGDFTRPDKERGALAPGVLSAIAPALPETDGPRNRVDLAEWLIAPENPLTPRVTVNRIWMRYFGRGLVETEEDFGTQGSLPSHPELLDYLAHRFVRDGWSMKKLHRLIVTSATYQQSSKARPDLAEKDPRNLLLARQARVRLDAEIVRDAALCASGKFAPAIGGPGVYPPQPGGIYSFTQSKKNWRTSEGPDRYRRGMYTFFYRSAPYPLFGTFDAPDFQTTCTRRARSNTPLQALNIANDPAFIELAEALALRVVKEVPGEFERTLASRLERAFRLALNRPPAAAELSTLESYARGTIQDLAADRAAALEIGTRELTAAGTLPEQGAALVAAARAILNTDNFITRE